MQSQKGLVAKSVPKESKEPSGSRVPSQSQPIVYFLIVISWITSGADTDIVKGEG